MADYSLWYRKVTEKRNSTLNRSLVVLLSDLFPFSLVDLGWIELLFLLFSTELVELFELSVIRHVLPPSSSTYSKKKLKVLLKSITLILMTHKIRMKKNKRRSKKNKTKGKAKFTNVFINKIRKAIKSHLNKKY